MGGGGGLGICRGRFVGLLYAFSNRKNVVMYDDITMKIMRIFRLWVDDYDEIDVDGMIYATKERRSGSCVGYSYFFTQHLPLELISHKPEKSSNEKIRNFIRGKKTPQSHRENAQRHRETFQILL